jgi:hypothetical protein
VKFKSTAQKGNAKGGPHGLTEPVNHHLQITLSRISPTALSIEGSQGWHPKLYHAGQYLNLARKVC